MSRYSKMQAPPFWMWMFRIAGIACLITLLTPTAYLLKYALLDRPNEIQISSNRGDHLKLLTEQPFPDGTELYIKTAEGRANISQRLIAVQDLGGLAASRVTQITHPVECLHAKLALEQVAESDPNTTVRSEAESTLMHVASNGAVIQR